jgi:hypothetical protein
MKKSLSFFDRVTLVINLHFEQENENPLTTVISTSKFLETKGQQPYVRKFLIGKDWVDLDDGKLWLEETGLVLIENQTGNRMAVLPDDEELKSIEASILELSNGLLIRPSLPFLGELTDLSQIKMRSLGEKPTKVQITIFPR